MPAAGDGTAAAHRALYETIWSCLATTFACTWIALHPGVPRPNGTHKAKTPSRWNQVKRRFKLMIGVMIAPEFLILWAVWERLLAKRIVEEYNRFCDAGEPTLTPPQVTIYLSLQTER